MIMGAARTRNKRPLVDAKSTQNLRIVVINANEAHRPFEHQPADTLS
jgi:hypothetical protein